MSGKEGIAKVSGRGARRVRFIFSERRASRARALMTKSVSVHKGLGIASARLTWASRVLSLSEAPTPELVWLKVSVRNQNSLEIRAESLEIFWLFQLWFYAKKFTSCFVNRVNSSKVFWSILIVTLASWCRISTNSIQSRATFNHYSAREFYCELQRSALYRQWSFLWRIKNYSQAFLSCLNLFFFHLLNAFRFCLSASRFRPLRGWDAMALKGLSPPTCEMTFSSRRLEAHEESLLNFNDAIRHFYSFRSHSFWSLGGTWVRTMKEKKSSEWFIVAVYPGYDCLYEEARSHRKHNMRECFPF